MVRYVSNRDIDIILAQDFYCYSGTAPGFPPSWPFFFSGNLNAAIFITNSDFHVIETLTLNNTVFISLQTVEGTLFIGSQYSAPSGNIENDFNEWTQIFRDFDNMIIGGDFNVPMRSLGYTREDGRTEVLLEHIINYSLTILNDPDAEHSFVQGDLKGRPDLTIAGLNICPALVSWEVDSLTHTFSDHRYILYALDFAPLIKKRVRYRTKNVGFGGFYRDVLRKKYDWLKSLIEVKSQVELDEWILGFHNQIDVIMAGNFKLKKFSHKPTFEWFTDEIRIERNKLSALYKRTIRNPTVDTYKTDYKYHRNQYKNKVKRAKRKAWLDYCEKTSEVHGNLYKFTAGKNLRHSDFIFTHLEHSAPFSNYDDIANQLMEEHFGVNVMPDNITEYVSDRSYFGDPGFRYITSRELKYAVAQQASNKAPGYDNLDPIVVKYLCRKFPDLIKAIFNKCISLGHFPRPWKKGIVLFFRKRNKSARSPRGYRPITLLPVLAKILERILNQRIVAALESAGYMDDAQHGFRKGKSTVTALKVFKNLVHEILLEGKYCAFISIDIEGAFDYVSWRIVTEIIDELPIDQYLASSIKNYLSNREIGIALSAGIIWFLLYRGCPQGSCLGPFVWSIVANKLLRRYRQMRKNIISYADDFGILEGGNTRRELEDNVNTAVALFSDISNQLELRISTTKSISMLLGSETLPNRRPIFKLAGNSIPVKDTVKYLGFTIDARFSWLDHLEIVREDLRGFTSNIKRTGCRDKGIRASLLKSWYLTVLQKKITYGFEVWFDDLKSHGLRKLSSCQRVALLTVIRSYRTTSTDAICALAGIPPIHIDLRCKIACNDVIHGDKHIILEETQINSANIMRSTYSQNYMHYLSLNNLSFISSVSDKEPSSPNPIIYTDGSKMESGTSMGFTVLQGSNIVYDYSARLHNFNSIYQAELAAINHAISWFIESTYQIVSLYTDSFSSVQALGNLIPGNSILDDIYNKLINNPDKLLMIGWIKAHVGLKGNERADFLAKDALSRDDVDVIEDIGFPVSIVKKYYRKKVETMWQTYWTESKKGRDTYAVIKYVDTKFICSTQIQVYYISGHGCFPDFLHKIGKRQNSNCNCGKTGNVVHYIFGRCTLMKYWFRFNPDLTMRQNLRSIILDGNNYSKLKENYNILIAIYSFIKYKY